MIALLARVMMLAASLSPTVAEQYAESITPRAERYRVDPLLVMAVIRVESNWHAKAKSRRHSYGLMQLHVSKNVHAAYQGREKDLYEPDRNILLGISHMDFWRRHHERHCVGTRHTWISHYAHGVIVDDLDYETKVMKVYRQLQALRNRLLVPTVS